MSDSEQEITEPKRKKKRNAGWYGLAVIIVLVSIYLLDKPLRKHICEKTDFCFNTCDKYFDTCYIGDINGFYFIPKGCGCEGDEAFRRKKSLKWLYDLFKPELTPENTKGFFMTEDGIYKDGVLVKPYIPKPTLEKAQEPQTDER